MMESALVTATREAALRLLKSQMRLLVLESKRDRPGGNPNVWGPLVGLEEGFVVEAQKNWISLLASWGWTGGSVRLNEFPELTEIIDQTCVKAREEVTVTYSERFPEEDYVGILEGFEPSILPVFA